MLLDDVVFDICQCSDARPISTDLHYLSVTANSTKQGRPISLFEWELEHLIDHKHSRHSNDDFHSGTTNTSPSPDHIHLEDQTTLSNVNPRFKLFTVISTSSSSLSSPIIHVHVFNMENYHTL